MNPIELLNIYDIHKDGKLRIEHHPFDETGNLDITLGDLFKMFKVVYERDMNAATQY